jgi:Type IV secretory pathway, VirB3-like protein.
MTRHPVYRALHVPKTVFGLDIELLMYAGSLALLCFNLFQSAIVGFMVMGLGYGILKAVTAREPRMIAILWSQRPARFGGTAGEDRYDAARWVVHEDQH